MAGGKESPRQKMIGMMYLVLTAMLALNVSKSILDAFITIDEQSLEQNTNIVRAINGVGDKIGFLKQDPQAMKTALEIEPIFNEIKRISNNVDDHFYNEMNEMFLETEGKKWFTKDPVSQVTDFLPLDDITKKDDYDTPTRFFGGDTPKSDKRGKALREKLIEYRDKLIVTVADSVKDDQNVVHVITKDKLKSQEAFFKFLEDDKHPNKSELSEIYSSLTKKEKVLQHKEPKDWNVARFYHQPMVGVVSTITSLRNDIRLAQQKSSKMLLSRIDKPMMNINKVEAQVIASTQYLNVGEKLDVKVGIVAFDSTKKYPVKYRMSSSGDYTQSDSGAFVLSAGSPGKRQLEGMLEVELAGTPTDLPFSFEYTVGKPSASIAAPELNVMYRGYDNKIQAVASGYPPDVIKVSCDGCTSFQRNGDVFIAKVGGGREATVSVKADGKTIGFQKFRIMPLPKPQPYFGGKTLGNKTIQTGILKQTPPLSAKLADSPLNVKFSVKSFTLDVIVNGKIITERARGGALSPKMKNMVRNAKKGQKIYIYDVMVAGPDGRAMPIGGLTFKVI